jgi:alanine racemase
LEPENTKEFVKYLSGLPGIETEGIFTHFTESDNKESRFTAYQLDRFASVIDELNGEGICPPIKHAANSAGIFLHPASHLDMVRIGISMYGLHPSNDTRDVVDLKPALSLKARISFIKKLKEKNGVSYNRTYVTSRDTVIATIPIGYGDGYTRKLSNKSGAIIRGQKCRAVGNICMDQFMVELNDGMEAATDDEVILIGRQGDQEITVDEVADLVGTINYEIVCMVNTRVPRVYKG